MWYIMALSSSDYAKASPAEYSHKEWYHGEMIKDKAERELTACGNNCFLVRESKGALILSLLLNGEAHHFNIEYGPGSYRLQASSSGEKFSELTELVTHCCSHAIKITLGVACKKSHTTRDGAALVEKKDMEAGDKDTLGLYTKGEPADLTKYQWYHGEMTKKETERVLDSYKDTKNRFLVRQSAKNLVLSMKISGYIFHTTITSSPRGYCLKGKSDFTFRNIPEMITHYLMFPIQGTQLLGPACDRESSRSHLTKQVADYSRDLVQFKERASQFTVSWRSCADLPGGRSVSHVVRIGGFVYVGGGMMKQRSSDDIFSYDLSKDSWTSLPYCPTFQHGLATLNGELLAIGGQKGRDITNTLYTFMNGTWKEVLPPMPTPRYLLSTISHDNRLIIAAGGVVHKHSDGELILTDIVEIYKERQWYTTKRLPFPTFGFLTNIIEDKCYILGGSGGQGAAAVTTLYTTLSSLLDNAEPADSVYSMPQVHSMWEEFQGTYPFIHPSNIVEVKGMLITMGGADESHNGTTFMSTYNFHTDTWVECGGAELPVALWRSNVVKLDNDKVMVIGGQPKERQFSAKVFIGTLVKNT